MPGIPANPSDSSAATCSEKTSSAVNKHSICVFTVQQPPPKESQEEVNKSTDQPPCPPGRNWHLSRGRSHVVFLFLLYGNLSLNSSPNSSSPDLEIRASGWKFNATFIFPGNPINFSFMQFILVPSPGWCFSLAHNSRRETRGVLWIITLREGRLSFSLVLIQAKTVKKKCSYDRWCAAHHEVRINYPSSS